MPIESIKRFFPKGLKTSENRSLSEEVLESKRTTTFDAIAECTYTNELEQSYFKALRLGIPDDITRVVGERIIKNYGKKNQGIFTQEFLLIGHKGAHFSYNLGFSPQIEPGYVIEGMNTVRNSLQDSLTMRLVRQEQQVSSIFTVCRAIWDKDSRGNLRCYVRGCLDEEHGFEYFKEHFSQLTQQAARHLESKDLRARYNALRIPPM